MRVEKRERELLLSIEIDNFSEYIQVSKSRRAVSYIKGHSRLPKKYMTEEFGYNTKNQLINLVTGDIVIKNSRTAGKPRYKKINGQEIYNGNISRQARAALVKKIHEYFIPHLTGVKLPDNDLDLYPLTLEIIFCIHRGSQDIDNDNKWIWRKCIQDTLTEVGFWKDDNNDVVNRNEEETIFIPESESQKLIINLYTKGGYNVYRQE